MITFREWLKLKEIFGGHTPQKERPDLDIKQAMLRGSGGALPHIDGEPLPGNTKGMKKKMKKRMKK
jgi:hypothetical protein